jgi:hypothetical protein
MANKTLLVLLCVVAALALFATPAHAFGAGNIASISRIEGRNWRHGDIEDMLKTVEFLKKHKVSFHLSSTRFNILTANSGLP